MFVYFIQKFFPTNSFIIFGLQHLFYLPILHLGVEAFQYPEAKQVADELDPVVSSVYPILHKKEIVVPLRYCPFSILGDIWPFDKDIVGQVTTKMYKNRSEILPVAITFIFDTDIFLDTKMNRARELILYLSS